MVYDANDIIRADGSYTNIVSLTIEVIHSRAWTFPCQMTAGLVPEPLEPKMLIPWMVRPPTEVPLETSLALLGKVATRSVRNCK